MLHIKVDRCLGTATEFPLWYEICGYTKTFLSHIYSFIHLLPIYSGSGFLSVFSTIEAWYRFVHPYLL